MSGSAKSKNHHWWPVGLQSYWADKNGEVSWIEPDETTDKKRSDNRKIGYKIHGHTMLHGGPWENNFEEEFDIDNEVHSVIGGLKSLRPLGASARDIFVLAKQLFNKERGLKEYARFYHMNEKMHRHLLLLLCSLLIRSPSARNRYENYPSTFGLPPDQEVGKVNMLQKYKALKKLCESGRLSNQYFLIIHSPFKKFIFGDGFLDWLTDENSYIKGRALVPLTPTMCVYFCTPRSMRHSPNCASLYGAPWVVDRINEITQIYSRDKLFFLGKRPQLTEAFRARQFLALKMKGDPLLDMFEELAGVGRTKTMLTLGSTDL